VEKLEEIK